MVALPTGQPYFMPTSNSDSKKAHGQRITRILTGRQGIWLSNRWSIILFAFLAVYTILIVLFVKF